VNPWGEVVAAPWRGMFMGNRGVLHDDSGRIVRHHRGKRWIACVTEFKGRRRPLLQPGRYTELFFLDEAVALAAGHRPCAECRRLDYQAFGVFWRAARGELVGADAMDNVLHADRVANGGAKVTFVARPASLPDGTVVESGGRAVLLPRREVWTDAGWAQADGQLDDLVRVLTPRAMVAILEAGYRPQFSAPPT
jgi:hypothetical protein